MHGGRDACTGDSDWMFWTVFATDQSQSSKDVYDSWMQHELVLNLVIHSPMMVVISMVFTSTNGQQHVHG